LEGIKQFVLKIILQSTSKNVSDTFSAVGAARKDFVFRPRTRVAHLLSNLDEVNKRNSRNGRGKDNFKSALTL